MADEPDTPAPGAGAPRPAEQDDTRSRLAEAQLEQAMDGYHALRAENDNLRAQMAEMEEKQRAASKDIGASLERQKKAAARELKTEREGIYARYIEILDNFDRAFDSTEARGASPSLMEGFILVRNQVVQVLRDGGFDRVRTLGLPYDPGTSEALEIEEVDDPAHDGVVIRELVRGYRMDDHIVRAAKVVVGRYSGPEKPDSGETARPPDPEMAADAAATRTDSEETLRIPDETEDEVPPVDGTEGEKD